jgi:5-(carboxyamino)imidazole ribonucleotide synthase
MDKLVTSDLKLGIIAGGQLGKMLIQEASKWDISTYVLDMEENCPASGVASVLIRGSQVNYDDVYNFGKKVDILTYELENINIDALLKLKEEGLRIVPDPEILQLIQDKGLQKDFYSENNIPTSPYKHYQNKNEIINDINSKKLKFPFVQKLRKGGYDGRGVSVLDSENDLAKLMDAPCIVEQKIDIQKEIAVIVARNKNGETKCFPPVEMVFDSEANLVEKLFCPANITENQSEEMKFIAEKLANSFKICGLLAVEFFISAEGSILVNEVAPRPHNSGHHTIESIITSQFEQHLRAILNLPLGSTQIKLPSVMINILGEKGYEGPVYYEGLTECMAIDGVKIHLYGKKITKPSRKMGHITIVAKSVNEALSISEKVKKIIKVRSWNKS